MDYTAIHEAQDAARARGRATALSLLASLDPLLRPRGWAVEAPMADADRDALPGLAHTDGGRVWCRLDWRNPIRMEVHGSYPASPTSGMITRQRAEGPAPITLSVSRDPESAARDLSRRFLTPYLAAFARAQQCIREEQATLTAQLAAAQQIRDALGDTYKGDRAALAYCPSRLDAGGHFEVSYSGERVTVHITCSVEAAAHFARYLRQEVP